MTSTEVRNETVLREIAAMIEQILDEAGLGEPEDEITRATVFHADLELQSIDLVVLAGMLEETYGPSVKLAAFAAELNAEQILSLTVGQLVDYVIRQVG
ncbi:acyl carrier protein [Lentzea alba]|uniref:acyl carrier protein n=1 Tax=Lentzea alba TaxID=2714351 RepID=UPI0039BFD214